MPTYSLDIDKQFIKNSQIYETQAWVCDGQFEFYQNQTTPNYPMQSWQWATQFWLKEKQSVLGHKAWVVNVFDKSSEAWIQSVVYQYPWYFKQNFLTIPRGPLCSPNWYKLPKKLQSELMQDFIVELDNLAKNLDSAFIKIEPTWDGDQKLDLKAVSHENEIAELNYDFSQKLLSLLSPNKVHLNSKFLQPPFSRTIQIEMADTDIVNQEFEVIYDKNFEALIAQFESKTRYNARLASKKGLRVEWDKTEAGFEKFWSVMLKTAERQKFKLYSKSYYYNVLNNDWADLALVYTPQGQVSNVWMGSFLNDMGMYLYGGSDLAFSNLKGAELVHTAAMLRTAQKCGKISGDHLEAYYDMGGSSLLDGKIPAWDGYSKFKKGFGGRIVEYLPHTFDYVFKPFHYKLISFIIHQVKPLLRRHKSSADLAQG